MIMALLLNIGIQIEGDIMRLHNGFDYPIFCNIGVYNFELQANETSRYYPRDEWSCE